MKGRESNLLVMRLFLLLVFGCALFAAVQLITAPSIAIHGQFTAQPQPAQVERVSDGQKTFAWLVVPGLILLLILLTSASRRSRHILQTAPDDHPVVHVRTENELLAMINEINSSSAGSTHYVVSVDTTYWDLVDRLNAVWVQEHPRPYVQIQRMIFKALPPEPGLVDIRVVARGLMEAAAEQAAQDREQLTRESEARAAQARARQQERDRLRAEKWTEKFG